jgi:cytoskeleton protein RodZ
MSEDQEKPPEEILEVSPPQAKPVDEPTGPLAGERLAEARREQQISVFEIAKELHLDEPKVRALESNNFDVLGAAVFAKGHLRKYAHLIGVDEDDVIADYYQMTRTKGVPPVVVGKTRIGQELSPGPWIAIVIVVIVAAASYWWFATRSEPDAAPAPVPEEPGQPESTGQSSSPIDEPVVLAMALPDEEPAVQTLHAGEMSLRLSFSGDCWTEISDATGRRLFYEMGRAGRSVELSGKAPLTALFGNAQNVRANVNGNNYPVSPSSSGGRMARLTILNQ